MATLDTLQDAVNSLTTSTTSLVNEVQVKKATLDASVADAESAQTGAQAARDTANLHKIAAEAAATSATNTAAALTGFDLDAIAATKGVTAVDVFVYDTSKDSDGGAWRKRTQHTSWYNETLNTSTRGSRREFPAVAVIVAERNKVTIYDGDDPSLPMWMVFTGPSGTGTGLFVDGSSQSHTDITAVQAKNAQIVLSKGGSPATGAFGGLASVSFVSEIFTKSNTRNDEYAGTLYYPISERNTVNPSSSWGLPRFVLVSNVANDVAMTVLPNAPIDPATGLPVPTIAVATDGGVSVIRDDGTVVDLLDVASTITDGVSFDNQNTLYVHDEGRKNIEVYYTIPSADVTDSPDDVYNEANAPHLFGSNDGANLIPLAFGDNYLAISKQEASGTDKGLSLLASDKSNKSNGMVAYTTSTYNTGWMNGDIKGAFLSDTNDTDLVGGELVTNGTFDTDTNWTKGIGWTIGSGVATHAAGTGSDIVQAGVLEVGKRYKLSVDVTAVNATSTLYVSGVGGYLSIATNVSVGSYEIEFTADTTDLEFRAGGPFDGSVDNISVIQIDADRSVNANGLIVNGTVTRSPVATGAELVAYSGFSASNYLEQPYNSALDFGTGDFCVMGWVKTSAISDVIIDGRDASAQDGFVLTVNSSGYANFATYESGATSSIAGTSSVSSDVWKFICAVRSNSGTNLLMYVDGNLENSSSVTARDISSTSRTTRVGLSFNDSSPWAGSLALWRISATAPSPEQISRIYNDEKVLFQDGAQATLYGSSDAVTALAYDDSTNLLHVGTSAGRSVFQGLRRVSNTTTAVGTAISASNGLVVEE